MVITIEPGIYLPGFGGIRVEDAILVTRAGAHVLTEFSKKLQVIG
jgi:Xaa-Pro aminopeptidase